VSEIAPAGGGKVIDLMEALRAKARATASQLGPRKAPKRVETAAKPARKATKR
jgi:hypothetical protein